MVYISYNTGTHALPDIYVHLPVLQLVHMSLAL